MLHQRFKDTFLFAELPGFLGPTQTQPVVCYTRMLRSGFRASLAASHRLCAVLTSREGVPAPTSVLIYAFLGTLFPQARLHLEFWRAIKKTSFDTVSQKAQQGPSVRVVLNECY